MKVQLFVNEENQSVQHLKNNLVDQGFEDVIIDRLQKPEDASKTNDVTHHVLILAQQSLQELESKIALASARVGGDFPLMVCARRIKPSDQRAMSSMRKLCFVTPADWSADALSDRILGQLFLQRPETREAAFFVGQTLAIKSVYEELKTLAPYDDPVLVLGERGTGKELCARLLHRNSGRTGELIPVNCASLTTEMLESELFGHAKGAFTNAHQKREGLLAYAKSGTVFLDEIGELSKQSQAKILRVLEDQKVRPVGANATVDVEARIVLATNRNLSQESQVGHFRFDLFDRIKPNTVRIPPLRRRKADIPLLAQHFVHEFNDQYGKQLHVSTESLDTLFQFDWPGNIRELRGVIQRASKSSPSPGPVDPAVLEKTVSSLTATYEFSDQREEETISFSSFETWREVQTRVWQKYTSSLLRRVGGNKIEAAKIAGMASSTFYERLKDPEKKEKP